LLATQWRTPNSRRVRRLASRLGGASLPMFALHVPLFVIFTRLERVLAGEPGLCTSEFRACLGAAGDSSLMFYPLFLALTVLFCVMFQEQFVLRVRNAMQRRLLPRVGSSPSHTEKVAR